jgi:glycosyltransferase involved in cell wall biosynthesis
MPAPEPAKVAAAIERLLADSALRERLGAAGRASAADYAWERRIDALESFLEGVARPRRIAPSTSVVPELQRSRRD